MTPVQFQWDGEHMIPQPRFARLCDKQFVVGEHYTLIPHEERSRATHSHYFAALHDAWLNLPDALAEQFPTEEHLRKYALIRTGFADERSIVCGTKAEAQRVAAFIKPMDHFAVVVVREATIKVYTAQSQSMKAMGKAEFQRSKQAVLDFVSDLIGVQAKELAA